MIHTLENERIKVSIDSKGAELKSLILKENNEEFMWDGNPKFWGKTSPILFPFIGALKEGKFNYKEKKYNVSKHGFAREMEFELTEKQSEKAVFKIESNEETMKNYPFEFELYIIYKLKEKELTIKYIVQNKTNGDMYFSLGAHPAFAVPTNKEIQFSDYYIEFEKSEKSKINILDGILISREKKQFLDGKKIFLKRELFKDDAIIFEDLKSKKISIKNTKNTRKITVDYNDFPIIAFWNVVGADYICVEPWCGIADFVDASGKLEEKYMIEKLCENEKFSRVLKIEVNL